MEPPKNYKPGIGRGALGFSTRGNIGFVAKEPVDDNAAKVYANIDKRKKKKHTEREEDGFESLKSKLQTVDAQEWFNLPDAMDVTFRNKRLRTEQVENRRSYALPDSMLLEEIQSKVDFAQLTKIDPSNPQGWIGYAKAEQEAMHFKKARSVIDKGCKKCSGSVEVWMTALEIYPDLPEKRSIIARAVEALPNSIELWLKAVKIEALDSNKLKVVQKGLESNPESSELWILAVNLEPNDDAKTMALELAVDLVPACEELWLMYFKQTKDESILDKALTILPQSVPLWSAKVFLHESSRDECLQHIVDQLPNGDWEQEINCQLESVRVCAKIVQKFNLDPAVLNSDEAKRAAFKSLAPNDPKLYLEWAETGDKDALEQAIKHFPSASTWRLYLKFENTLPILERAYNEFPDDFVHEYIERIGRAKALELLKSLDKDVSLWVKYVELLDKPDDAIVACKKGLTQFPQAGELYLLLHTLAPSLELLEEAVVKAPKFPELWLRLLENTRSVPKKRAVLQKAMSENRNSEKLWLARISLEDEGGKNYTLEIEKALKECPNSGMLWAKYLQRLDDIRRKGKFATALKETNSHPAVLYELGVFYWRRGNKEAQAVMEKASNAGSIEAQKWLIKNRSQ